MSEKVFIVPSLLKVNFTGYRIINWWFFPFNTKYLTPLSCRKVSDESYVFFNPPSSIGKLLKISFLFLVFCSLSKNRPKYRFFLVFYLGTFWATWIYILVSVINFGTLLAIIKIFHSFPLLLIFPLLVCYPFCCNCPHRSYIILFHVFHFFSLCTWIF